MSTTATKSGAVDLITPKGFWLFIAASPDVVLVEHWPARPGKRAGFPRGSSLSRAAAKRLYANLKAQAL